MNPWIAKAVVLAGTLIMIAIRAPHGHPPHLDCFARVRIR
jgi:hypothetical protein